MPSETHNPQSEAVLMFGATDVAQLTNVSFGGSTSSIDVTNNDSPIGTAEKLVGQRDPGSVSADYIATAASATALHTAWLNRTSDDVTVTFWTGGFDKEGVGFISDFSIETGELDGQNVVTGSIEVTFQTDEYAV